MFSKWICQPQVTARFPASAGHVRDLRDVAGRLGMTLRESGGNLNGAESLCGCTEHCRRALFRFLLTVQRPSCHFFLEAVVQTDCPAEKLPDGYKPDAGGFIRIETHNFYDLITWVCFVCALLSIEVPENFEQFVRYDYEYVPAGGDVMYKARQAGYTVKQQLKL